MHGIDMRKHEDTSAFALRPRHERVAESGSAGHALEPHRNPAQVRGDAVDHAIDSRNVARRAFDFDPALDTFHHCADVDRIRVWMWHLSDTLFTRVRLARRDI
jgi:hypothetical protein